MTWRAILFPKFKAKGTHPVRQIFFNLLCSFKDGVAARLYVQRAISPNILQKFKKTQLAYSEHDDTPHLNPQKEQTSDLKYETNKFCDWTNNTSHYIEEPKLPRISVLQKKLSLSKNHSYQRRRKEVQRGWSVERKSLETVYLTLVP